MIHLILQSLFSFEVLAVKAAVSKRLLSVTALGTKV